MKKNTLVVLTTLIVLGIVGILVSTNLDTTTVNTTTSETTNQEEKGAEKEGIIINERTLGQLIKPLPTPDYITLGGEEVPVSQYDIRERLDRELLVNTYWHSSMIRMLKQANRYFPTIEPILAEHGVPDDFKYLALAESGLEMSAASYAGAKGPWQFMKAAAKQFGLELAEEVDERYHIEKATHAAAKYLLEEKKALKSWTLAAAAYNAGRTSIRRQLERQKVKSYYDLYLNTETSRYVFRILAIKEIHQNPEKYGFYLDSNTMYQPIQTAEIEVKSIPSIATFAQKYGTTYKEVKLLNPWLRHPKLSARKSGKKYLVKVPI